MSEKTKRLFITIIPILLTGWLMSACTGQDAPVPTVPPTPIARKEAPAATTQPPPPAISITSADTVTAVPTHPAPSPTVIIAPTETAAAPPEPTTAPIITSTPLPLPTPAGTYSWTLNVPILMYHYVSIPPADANIYRTDLSTPPELFRRQMAYLAENGYTPIDLYQLSTAIAAKIDLPEKPVVITFDDGYLDNYENAFPILQEYGFTATFFVITDLMDQGADGYMNWEQLAEMAAAGMRIESHSKNHPDLRGKSRDFVIFQLLGSQETIAANTGYTPRYFCYPGGFYDQTSIDILHELDFWGAVTTQGGAWHGYEDRYEWTRQRMRHDTTMEEFGWMVDLGGTVGGKREIEE